MKSYTSFSTITEFFKESNFNINSKEDFKNINENDLDNYTRESTNFNNWNEMRKKAFKEYIVKKIQK